MIYVLCPADVKTGGTELLHQLVKTLTDVKVPAGIVYTEISEEHPGMNPAFLEYTDGYLREEEIEDEKGNILVVPEIYCERTARYQNLSVYKNALNECSFGCGCPTHNCNEVAISLAQSANITVAIGNNITHALRAYHSYCLAARVPSSKLLISFISAP